MKRKKNIKLKTKRIEKKREIRHHIKVQYSEAYQWLGDIEKIATVQSINA